MQRLFWKFFAIIWLSMSASIAVLFMVLALLQVVPFSREVGVARQVFALDVATQLLERQGPAAVEAFAADAAKASTPVKLSILPVTAAGGCVPASTGNVRTLRHGDACYHISLAESDVGFLSLAWPKVVPWFSALLAAAIAAYCLARYLLGPVAQLRGGLSALAAGRFDVRIGDKIGGRRDEVAALAHDFDASAARLEALQQAQQRLFHDVSHELRSPLSRLSAAIGVLEQNPAKLDITMARMVREIERIDGLVGEILTLARLTNQSKEGLDVQTLDVIDLLDDIVADAAFEAEARGVTVRHDRAGAFVADVNGELIYRAIENVVRNAVKYTGEQTQVSVLSQIEGGTLRIVVTDEGPGVPTADLNRIFHAFSRGEHAASTGGYGLGLAITKHAIERHGGHVTASPGKDGGLIVKLELPRSL